MLGYDELRPLLRQPDVLSSCWRDTVLNSLLDQRVSGVALQD